MKRTRKKNKRNGLPWWLVFIAIAKIAVSTLNARSKSGFNVKKDSRSRVPDEKIKGLIEDELVSTVKNVKTILSQNNFKIK